MKPHQGPGENNLTTKTSSHLAHASACKVNLKLAWPGRGPSTTEKQIRHPRRIRETIHQSPEVPGRAQQVKPHKGPGENNLTITTAPNFSHASFCTVNLKLSWPGRGPGTPEKRIRHPRRIRVTIHQSPEALGRAQRVMPHQCPEENNFKTYTAQVSFITPFAT